MSVQAVDIPNLKTQNTIAIDALAAEETFAAHLAFGEALQFWLKLGIISFGAPASQISIM